jgi:hypothetical protein
MLTHIGNHGGLPYINSRPVVMGCRAYEPIQPTNTNALNEMLKRVQHDKKKRVISNLVLNLIQDCFGISVSAMTKNQLRLY